MLSPHFFWFLQQIEKCQYVFFCVVFSFLFQISSMSSANRAGKRFVRTLLKTTLMKQ